MATTINDIVLVHIDNKPAFHARIEDISPDAKPGWWQVKLLVLTVPLQVYNWILDESQVNGAPFTMSGTPIMLEKIVSPEPPLKPVPPVDNGGSQKKGNVVSLFDRKKN
ncbi:hypothetical protein KOM00_11740 [Geomonas sp. Red69]|uniref:Uncharacterized protein n=1 Tax=Geomonas diazotrophica TaxID=2843197 RepID=A0ABX8JMV4_9BACT|nr:MULTISPECIES: hypothetical protein [Geomonas]MBU5637403.1 hypothetical protein [Geomonas diazotrophica]QWV97929.1 hypothetical protein KP005_01125 [Geomonas nitrogeniifigens]QXE87069.1 hypothetical protein KP003_01270 [Geomonas nitrogeniifigens]